MLLENYLGLEAVMTFISNNVVRAAVCLMALWLAAPAANAGVLTINFSNGGAFVDHAADVPANSPGIYASAVFADVAPGQVSLTMRVFTNLVAGAYVNDWYFNVNPALGLPALSYASGTQAASVDRGTDGYKADGTGGLYDIVFHFATRNPGGLARGASSVWNITAAGLTAQSFDFYSTRTAGGGSYAGAVHVQGYGNSVWLGGEVQRTTNADVPVAVPLPASAALMALGLLMLAFARRQAAASGACSASCASSRSHENTL